MKELKTLQQLLEKMISNTDLKDRNTSVALRINNGKPLYEVYIYKKDSDYMTEISSRENTLERCKLRLEFELKMYATKDIEL